MAAIDPTGSQLVWEDGLPHQGIKTVADVGTQKYWEDGLPGEFIFPASDAGQAAGHGGMMMMGLGS